MIVVNSTFLLGDEKSKPYRLPTLSDGFSSLYSPFSSTTTFAGVRLRRTTAPLETSGSFFLPTGKKSGGE